MIAAPLLLLLATSPQVGASEEPVAPEVEAPVEVDAGPEDPEAEARRLEEARSAYREGKAHFDGGRFEEALESMRRANELRPAALLIFNMAQCHRALAHWPEAIEHYERFLEESPDALNVAEVRALLEEVRVKQAAREERERARRLEEKTSALEGDVAAARAREEALQAELDRVSSEVKSLKERNDAAGVAGSEAELVEIRAEVDRIRRAREAAEAPTTNNTWVWVTAGVVGGVAVVATSGALGWILLNPDPTGSLGVVDMR